MYQNRIGAISRNQPPVLTLEDDLENEWANHQFYVKVVRLDLVNEDDEIQQT